MHKFVPNDNRDERKGAPSAMDENATEWIWPKQIEPWLYGIPTNIMLNIPDIGKVKGNYRAFGRKQIDNTFLAFYKNYRAIDAQHIDENCFVFK